MTEPKPGDRVRVTYEAVWRDIDEGFLTRGFVSDSKDSVRGVPFDATVEVLASPVYVNSDTTEYRDGDVVKADSPVNSRIWAYLSNSTCEPWCSLEKVPDRFTRDSLPTRLRLLVRDGQVVQP